MEGSIKTGLMANLTVSMIATIIYLPTIPIIMSFLHIPDTYIIIYLSILCFLPVPFPSGHYDLRPGIWKDQ
jgi:TctA family transporter